MRTSVLALALAAALTTVAVAEPINPDYSTRHTQHREQVRYVSVTFTDHALTERSIEVNGEMFRLQFAKNMTLRIPVGAVVTLHSNQQSSVDGTTLFTATTSDDYRTVMVL